MKKLLHRLRNIFKPKKFSWADDATEQLLTQLIKNHQAQSDLEALIYQSMQEEIQLTAGRPVTLLPASMTLH